MDIQECYECGLVMTYSSFFEGKYCPRCGHTHWAVHLDVDLKLPDAPDIEVSKPLARWSGG